MKKLLFFAMLCTATSVLGNQDVTVHPDTNIKLEGIFNFQAGARKQNNMSSDEKNISKYNRDIAFYTEAALSATVSQMIDDITYGGKVVLMPTANVKTSSTYNGSYMFLESDNGRVEIGAPYDAGSKMRVTAYDIAAATGDGWTRYASMDGKKLQHNGLEPDWGDYGFFLDGVHKPSLKQINDKTEPSRKVSYFTPQMEQFRLGISYIPDSSNTGVAKHRVLSSGLSTHEKLEDPHFDSIVLDQNVKNAFSIGVEYKEHIADGVDVQIAATGECGTSAGKFTKYLKKEILSENKLSNLRTYNFGAVLTQGNFSYGISYGNLGKSLTTKEYHRTGRKTAFYNGVIAYGQGPIKTSLSYFKSEQYKNTLDSVTLGTEYKASPGLLPYAEIAYFAAKGRPIYYPESPRKTTKGGVAIVGARLKL